MYASLDEIAAACRMLPPGDGMAEAAARVRQARLLKPPGSLGRLEELAAWLARWQGRPTPRIDAAQIIVFAGNHGVVAQGVSPYPATVTAQMVGGFHAGLAAISQLARLAGAALSVVPLDLDHPTRDFTTGPALDDAAFAACVSVGAGAIDPATDLLVLGEMGIGNTTAAAALAAALFGGTGTDWAGRGTGLDDAGLARKAAVVDRALARHAALIGDPLRLAAALGGRELAAILGAALAARLRGVPVLLDGYVSTAAAAPLALLAPGGLDHALVAHVSAEAAHRRLIERLGQRPLLDLGMRLGEASGAALAVPLLRAAVACHVGMATFEEAGVDGPV